MLYHQGHEKSGQHSTLDCVPLVEVNQWVERNTLTVHVDGVGTSLKKQCRVRDENIHSSSSVGSFMDALILSSQVTFVEVSAQFLPDDCLRVSEFAACDHKQREAVYEWVPSDQGPEVSLQL